ncbi:MAG: tetratricopeptide repeat protein [Flavobacteriaceae bacterium]|nr:tetratricopeptide repeat protein [Flavobacteriaceae bacterium]
MRKKSILLGALFTVSVWSAAQTTNINFDENRDFKHAKYLYLTETYKAAQNKFEKVLDRPDLDKNSEEAAEFYASLVALINNERGAEERFLAFQDKYPRSIYVRNGAWELGSFYLRNGDYDNAYKYLTLGNLNDLPERKRNEYQFKLGYVAFMKGNEREALRHLEPLVRSDKYQDEAAYYTGHIYYSQKNFEKAFTYFDALRKRNPDYETRVLPYVVQIEFNNGEYQKAIEDGQRLLSQNRDRFIQSEVSKIVGESYFQLKEYDKAIPYLEAYTGEKSNADYYQLGYAYYQKGDYAQAVSLFNKIIGEKTPLAQTAYYQLGNSYLQQSMKREALTAYKSASEMNFNAQIQEDAFYNYAKLSYDIGNPFVGTPEVLQSFIKTYPRSKYNSEINDYLVDAFISSGNYKNALDVLNKISNKTLAQLAAEQQAAFLYGSELVKEGKMAEAESNFNMAAKSNSDAKIKARATFWQGESNFRQDKFERALSNFKSFKVLNVEVPETKEIDYQLGYTYLKLRQYSNAASSFETYLATNPPGDFKADAKIRLADAYIGAKQTQKALGLYQEIATQNVAQSDEAAFNRAVVLGILGENDNKISALESFINSYPNSKYFENARLELAEAYLRKGDNNKAMSQLDALIKNGKPEMVARARLRKGLIYYNKEDNSRALTEFKSVAENYPRTQLALQGIDNAKRIYVEENNLTEFERWANGLGYYTVDQSELENLAYQSAKKTFDDKNYAAAIPQLESFISKYPNSGYANAINYSLGESYYLTESYQKAKDPLLKVAGSNNEFQEDALLRLSQIYLQTQETTEALLMLENLNRITTNPAYKTYAEINLMRLYSEKGQHNQAVQMADAVLQNSKNETSVLQEAELTKARSLFASKRFNPAREAYSKLESAASNAVKAEANYYKAWFYNQDKKYEISNEIVFYLASKFSEQQYWGSRALIVMADNYYNLGDLYQANATIDAVLDNYQNYPDVMAEANALKNKFNRK